MVGFRGQFGDELFLARVVASSSQLTRLGKNPHSVVGVKVGALVVGAVVGAAVVGALWPSTRPRTKD